MCEVQGARLIFNNCGNIFCLDAAGQQLHARKNTLQLNFELHYVNDVNCKVSTFTFIQINSWNKKMPQLQLIKR